MSSLKPEVHVLTTEKPTGHSRYIDHCSTVDALSLMNQEDATVAAAVAAEIPQIAQAVDAIVAAMEQGGRLFYLGAGSSGRLGVLDSVECVPTFSCSPDEVHAIIAGGSQAMVKALETDEDDAAMGAADLRSSGFTAKDALVACSSSGRTPYVLGAVREARGLGAPTIGVACNRPCELAGLVDVAITPLTGPEVILGSTRLKAGTATKMVLNMISTVVMARRGFVFKNLMVNVQPSNSKLVARAQVIVAELLDGDLPKAAGLLEAAGGSIKTAVVMGHLAVPREEAQRLLAEAGGQLSKVIGY